MNGLRLTDESNPDDRHREWKYALMLNNERVASGGLLLNYNFPYADVYVDVNEAHRGKGYGAMLVQEVKRMAYAIGRIPAARCRITNLVSKAMLMNAGFRVCGYWLVGKVHTDRAQS
jgi:GNAT superfamily N-acetyltransferase